MATLHRIAFHVTDRCQLNCDHCLRDPGHKPIDLDVELIARVLDQARARFATHHAGLTGGEPTLHPRFLDIVDAIVDRGFTWHVVTNGRRFESVVQRLAERPARLAAASAFNFSLDGATEQTHDAIREQGNFRTLMRAISVCSARELPFVLLMTINARNVHEIEAVALLASQLGARQLVFSFTQPTGTFLDQTLYLPPSEWRRATDRIARLRGAFKMDIVCAETGTHDAPFRICDMWRHDMLHVDLHGRLTLCCQLAGIPSAGGPSDVAGDLHQVSLAEAHLRFTEIVNDTVRARLAAISDPDLGEWERDVSCNWCLKRFGRPHWVDGGSAGPGAGRVRWRGKWTPGYKPSHALADSPAPAAPLPAAEE